MCGSGPKVRIWTGADLFLRTGLACCGSGALRLWLSSSGRASHKMQIIRAFVNDRDVSWDRNLGHKSLEVSPWESGGFRV